MREDVGAQVLWGLGAEARWLHTSPMPLESMGKSAMEFSASRCRLTNNSQSYLDKRRLAHIGRPHQGQRGQGGLEHRQRPQLLGDLWLE